MLLYTYECVCAWHAGEAFWLWDRQPAWNRRPKRGVRIWVWLTCWNFSRIQMEGNPLFSAYCTCVNMYVLTPGPFLVPLNFSIFSWCCDDRQYSMEILDGTVSGCIQRTMTGIYTVETFSCCCATRPQAQVGLESRRDLISRPHLQSHSLRPLHRTQASLPWKSRPRASDAKEANGYLSHPNAMHAFDMHGGLHL